MVYFPPPRGGTIAPAGFPEAAVRRAISLSVTVALGLAAGCERDEVASPAPAASPLVTVSAPATQPATRPTQRPASFVVIDQQPYEFPAAKLTLQIRDGKVWAQLFSDDPREAISRDYAGNSYYFPLSLEVESVADLVSATWSQRRSEADDTDTNVGIFLEGDRVQLEPAEVLVRFETLDDRETVVILSGLFRWRDERDPLGPPREVPVSARLAAEVKVR
jgi:hypothetical protein